jgi:hypothetical protein
MAERKLTVARFYNFSLAACSGTESSFMRGLTARSFSGRRRGDRCTFSNVIATWHRSSAGCAARGE